MLIFFYFLLVFSFRKVNCYIYHLSPSLSSNLNISDHINLQFSNLSSFLYSIQQTDPNIIVNISTNLIIINESIQINGNCSFISEENNKPIFLFQNFGKFEIRNKGSFSIINIKILQNPNSKTSELFFFENQFKIKIKVSYINFKFFLII